MPRYADPMIQKKKKKPDSKSAYHNFPGMHSRRRASFFTGTEKEKGTE